jgi:peptidoglycan hydrolase-like protein with peptidoglycan-binding domain
MVMALTATAIASNALFLQNTRHPDPIYKSRPAAFREAPRPQSKIQREQPRPVAAVIPPLPHPSPARGRIRLPEPPAVIPPPVVEIQRELARLGLYAGAIDGVPGARTSAAIAAYETAAGRPVTGQPTAELLEAMKQPLPERSPRAMALPDATAIELDQRQRQRAAAIAADEKSQVDTEMRKNFRVIQGALNRIGYGPVPVDGSMSEDTVDAIRRFELDNGLPISGEATEELIGRLIAIGAIKAT